MHHDAISKILQVVEEFFLLVSENPPVYQLESISTVRHDDEEFLGLRVTRGLLSGSIQIEIMGECEDDDSLTLAYLPAASQQPSESFEIEDSDYCSDAVREVVKKILVLDKNASRAAYS